MVIPWVAVKRFALERDVLFGSSSPTHPARRFSRTVPLSNVVNVAARRSSFHRQDRRSSQATDLAGRGRGRGKLRVLFSRETLVTTTLRFDDGNSVTRELARERHAIRSELNSQRSKLEIHFPSNKRYISPLRFCETKPIKIVDLTCITYHKLWL